VSIEEGDDEMNEELRDQFRYVAWALYPVAFLLVAGPSLDLAASIWPLSPTTVVWRFAATGLLSKALLVPILGSLAAMVAALVLEHRQILRVVAYSTAGLAILMIGTIPLFVLDAIQLRSGIAAEAMLPYDAAALRALVNLVLAGAALGGLGISGLKASRRTRRTEQAHLPLVSPSSGGSAPPAGP
jgi:hypothetical protein